jgi:rhamnogalacturonyl hydrolase YesR
MTENPASAIVTAVLITGIQKQREKLQRFMRKYTRASIYAFKHWDFEKGITNGAKALAAQQADQILAQQ